MKKSHTFDVGLTVVGLNFRWKREVRKMMPGWCPFNVKLEREPDNEYDEYAIKVLIANQPGLNKVWGKQLGYLRSNIAALLAPRLDAGEIKPASLIVTEIDVDGGQATIQATFRELARPVKKPGKRQKTA